jgi:hypothetical protein
MSIMAENNLCITERPNMDDESMPRKRPFSVTLLLWLVLSLSAWGAVRLIAAFRWWNVLNEFGARLGPLYLSITGAGWIVVGSVFLWGLFSGKSWARLAIPLSIFLWVMEYWVERMFFESPRANFFFALIASLLLCLLTFFSAFNQKTNRFFIRSEEHEQPNEHPDSA